MTHYPAPNPRYRGPAKYYGTKTNHPINRIVIHCTVSPCVPGGPRAIARYFRESVIRPSSAHYVVGPAGACQVVYDSWLAFHAPPNAHSIGVELCDMQRGSARRWTGPMHRMMLRRAARMVAKLCLAYEVPPHKIDSTGLLKGRRGVCGHVDVSKAWHQTSHTDPGEGFPWVTFMDKVETHYERLIRK